MMRAFLLHLSSKVAYKHMRLTHHFFIAILLSVLMQRVHKDVMHIIRILLKDGVRFNFVWTNS